MTMDAAELRAALETLGLKQTGQQGLTTFLNVSDVTVRRWARDTDGSPVPESVAMLLRLMIARRLKPATVRKVFGGDQPLQPVIADSRDSGRRA